MAGGGAVTGAAVSTAATVAGGVILAGAAGYLLGDAFYSAFAIPIGDAIDFIMSKDCADEDDYPTNPDDWNPPEGWEETPAGEKTDGRHRQWNGPDGRTRRWDAGGRKGGKERDSHWHDSDRPGEHIEPTR